VPPFWLSIAVLSVVQGALVALVGDGRAIPRLEWVMDRRSPLWAAILPLSVIVFVLVAQAAARASAKSLTYLALAAVPILAALALGWLARGARPLLLALTPALFALAWADRGGLAGESAALALSALSCVALGTLFAVLTPARWLALGVVLMACVDSALVISELLQHPNEVLTAAHPASGLPRLQAAIFGSATMGYGDLFVAGIVGGMLARGFGRMLQLRGAILVTVLALVFDLLFFAVNVLPATVPVALALVVLMVARRRGERSDTRPVQVTVSGVRG
jgi:hypothetical protein